VLPRTFGKCCDYSVLPHQLHDRFLFPSKKIIPIFCFYKIGKKCILNLSTSRAGERIFDDAFHFLR